MSGGEQQLLEVAMAVLQRPKILLVDEPSVGLSPAAIAIVFNELLRISAGGQTILLVEQNTKKAMEVAHRAVILRLGKVIWDGRPADITHDELGELFLTGPDAGRRPRPNIDHSEETTVTIFVPAARVSRIKISPTTAAAARVRELKAAGHDIVDMTIGEPDFDTLTISRWPPMRRSTEARPSIPPSTARQPCALRSFPTTSVALDLSYAESEICVGGGARSRSFSWR